MSRHSAHARYQGRVVLVVAGYDRPLDEVFLQVFGSDGPGQRNDEWLIYSSINEPYCDWSTVDTIAAKLDCLGIVVPATMLECVCLDQALRAGNRIEHHGWTTQAGHTAREP